MTVEIKSKKNNTALAVTVVCLTAGVILSLIVLFEIIVKYSDREFQHIIYLTETNNQTVFYGSENNNDDGQILTPPKEFSNADESENKGLSVYDENGVWHSQTMLEIFHMSYDNESGKITVVGDADNTDKLIAPGTSNAYSFTLANTGDVPLSYNMQISSFVTGTDYALPMQACVYDYKNNYLVGSEKTKADILDINGINETAFLGSNRYAVYTIEWEWPFEQGIDEYDTMLGNLAVDRDIVFTVVISVYAAYEDNPAVQESRPQTSGNHYDDGLALPPKTGDRSYTAYALTVMLSSVGVAVMIICIDSKKQKHGDKLWIKKEKQ